jgi:hypothetical protein
LVANQYLPKVTRSVSGADLKRREWSVLAPFLPPSAFKNSAGTGAANTFSAAGE